MDVILKLLMVFNLLKLFACSLEVSPIIEYEQGTVVGRFDTDRMGKQFFSFQGIPYAKPPVANLRFKPAVPLKSWQGTLNASKEGPVCPQKIYGGGFIGQEDCLYLNVYSPSLKNDLLPVLFFIHGGDLTSGSGNADKLGPRNLVSENVILVTLNYRLGALGFISFEDKSIGVSGNEGIKDVIVGLDWVQKYINYFGGDPEKVTLAGQSAGSIIANIILFSGEAKNSYRNVILQSGTPTATYAEGSKYHYQLAEAMKLGNNPSNIYSLTEQEIFDGLMKSDLRSILSAQAQIFPETKFFNNAGPTEESPYDALNPVLTRSTMEILESGEFDTKKPILMGFTDNEAILLYKYLKYHPDILPKSPKDIEQFLPRHLNLIQGSSEAKAAAEKIHQFYYGEELPTMTNIQNFFAMMTDLGFLSPISYDAKILVRAGNNKVFLYLFTLDTELNVMKRMLDVQQRFSGAGHFDECGYLFNSTSTPVVSPDSLLDINVRTVLALWTNFIKTGDPNGYGNNSYITTTWEPVKKDKLNYLTIGRTLKPGVDPFSERLKFHTELYEETNKNSGNIKTLSLFVLALLAMFNYIVLSE